MAQEHRTAIDYRKMMVVIGLAKALEIMELQPDDYCGQLPGVDAEAIKAVLLPTGARLIRTRPMPGHNFTFIVQGYASDYKDTAPYREDK